MHLLAPWWWLLLVPLGGLLILLYLLKLRRRDFVVPSVFFWEQVLLDLQSNAPLQKLRKNLLLIVQMLVLLLAIAALSRPAMKWRSPGGQSVVLVLDASASMQSTDISPSRFAAAQKEAHKAVDALGPHDRMMIVAVGGDTRALTPFSSDARALHAAIDRVRATDTRSDFRGALDLVAGLVKGRKGSAPSIVIISDGAVPPVELPAGLGTLHYQQIGRRSENVGIVVMDVRRRLSGRNFEGLIVVKNFSKSAKTFTLEMYLNDELQDAREITVAAGAQHTEVLQDLPANGGVLRAHLDVQDDLAVDNTAYLILPSIEPLPVELVTKGNIFLKTALSLDDTLKVTEHTSIPATLDPGTVLIADNVPVASLPRSVPALLIGPTALKSAGAAPLCAVREIADNPAIADWNRRNPVLANIDISGIHITQGAILTPATGAESLLETTTGPLAVTAERDGSRLLALGWDLHHSDFPLRVAFPIFLANALDWLSPAQQRAQGVNVRTGGIARLPLPPGVAAVTLHTPDGGSDRRQVTELPLAIDHLTRSGLYRVTAKDVDISFAANLLDAGESNLTPRNPFRMGGGDRPAAVARGPLNTEQELWRLLALLALVGLCVEWWLYHRRVG